MADDHIQTSAAQGVSAPPHGVAVNGPPVAAAPAEPGLVDEFRQLALWWFGAFLVLMCGWAPLILAVMWTRASGFNPTFILPAISIANFAVFLLLERNFWLSRLMSLRIPAGMPWWVSAMILWALGVPGLLFRSTAPRTRESATGDAKPETADASQQATEAGREVVETIVFVVVLVLLLKSFVAEAFVIPTGSMAETLYGNQKIVTCPSCGFTFPVNASRETENHVLLDRCVCPNCEQRIHLFSERSPRNSGGGDLVEFPDPLPGTGDRVLVAKFLYGLVQRHPSRLDVVVFKFPGNNVGSMGQGDSKKDTAFPHSGPINEADQAPMNYIKRLVGLSGETIAIFDGDVYVLRPPADGKPRFDDSERVPANELWQYKYMHRTFFHRNDRLTDLRKDEDVQAAELFQKGMFEIIRKNPENILAMKRIVYDNDFPATDTEARSLPNRWQGDTWASDGAAHSFRSDGSGNGIDWLRYGHYIRPTIDKNHPNGQRELITDFMGYNTGPPDGTMEQRGNNWVGDLVLETEAVVTSTSGTLTLQLSRGVDRFEARFNVADGTCKLFRIGEDREEKELGSASTPMRKPGTYQLRFANVDRRLTVWVGASLPFGDGVAYDAPAYTGPAGNDLEPASIGSTGAAVTVRHLRLWRDTYYTTDSARGPDKNLTETILREPEKNEKERKQGDDRPVLTLYVQPGHYLCLGDNSPASADSRSWGTVPERLMLGRALAVYYPFGRWGLIK